MLIEYDPESDAAFVWLVEPKEDKIVDGELWPSELNEHIGLLFDSEKKLIGIEILFASAHLPQQVLDEAIKT